MEFFHILFLFSFDFLSVMQASGKPDPPTDVQIHVNGSTARVSWIIPTNQGITWSRIYLQDSKNKTWDLNLSPKIKYIDIMSTTNSFEIENLKMCSEYIVKIKCIIKGDPKYSDFTRQHFWMTNKTFIADINQNVTLSWTTSLTEFFNVQSAFNSTIIYGVQGGGYIISNSESGKYIFDDTQTHVKDIKVTVIHVNKIDAGLYSAETTNGNVDGCCLLIVTTKPIKPVLTIQPEHPFVGDNITFTCSSTIQRWPTGYGTSHLSYQFIGNKRGATDNNELQINKLTLSDKGTSIKCQATDNLMQVSNMSTTVTLDPFYGPENVVVEVEIGNVNVTEGTALGPIHCIANCTPECNYIWKQNMAGKFEPVKHEFISNNNRSVHVPTITRNHAGTYRCRVDHPEVKGRKKIKDISVNVQSLPTKPTVTLRPKNPFVGDNITFLCNSTAQRWPGNISAHLSYQFFGNKRGETKNNIYIMHNLTKMDNGTIISCQATDDLGKVSNMSNTVILNPYYGPENVVVEHANTNLNITEGTALGPLHCIATCNPECNYIWNQNMTGNFEPVKHEFISNNTRSVYVPTITRNQAGTYRCRVDHPEVKGRKKIKDISVNVQSTPTQPTLTLRPNNPFVGDTITVTCNSTVQRWPGDISARLSYQFHTENDRGEFNNNRYVMNNLTKLDNGTTISCQATDDLGKVSNMSNTVLLDPFYGPENVAVEPSITNINITEGTTLGPLYCIATCNPECNYIWKQNMTGNFSPVPNELIFNNSVHVPTITRNQTGTFRCRVDHPVVNNRTKIQDIIVNVQYSSKVTEFWLRSNNESYGLINPPTFNFNEEVKVEMKLRVESNPDPQIMFNSTLLKIQPIHKGKQYIDYISNIPSLKCEESGNFSIQASNGIPYADTRTVNLNIYCKPRNATAKSGTIRTKIGTKENIVLNVTAFTAPNVTWLRETNFEWNVLNERYDYKHKLNSTIHIKTKDDFGSYGIKICNKLGCIVENITLKPQDKPEAPKNFSVKKATFQSVNISWIAGFDGGHKQTFWVKYKAKDDTKWDKKDVPSSNIKSGRTVYFTLDQLKPDTKYQVTVVSKNIKGQRNTSLDFKTEVQPTVKSPSKSASMTPIFIGIGCGFAVILMIITSVYVFFKRRHKASTSELAESNVLYAVVDKVQQKFKRRNMENEDSNMSNEPANAEYASVVKPKSKSKKVHYKEDEIETANDEYAVVDKSKRKINFTDDDTTYANQGDADLLIRQPSKKKPSGRSKNQDGLTYIEVSFTRKPKDRRRIIGAENRTNYVDIDFTRTADPLPETADE